jgi:hypothetical protein
MGTPSAKPRRPEGITLRHRKGCPADDDRSCRCKPAYQAQVYSPRDRRTIRKSFTSLSEARAWRADTATALRRGTMRPPTRTTLEEAADDWLLAARAGIARTRSGDPYKPSALRSYEEALRTKALPELETRPDGRFAEFGQPDRRGRGAARGIARDAIYSIAALLAIDH